MNFKDLLLPKFKAPPPQYTGLKKAKPICISILCIVFM